MAESKVIFFPIFQLGCFRASTTFTSFNFSTGQYLKTENATKASTHLPLDTFYDNCFLKCLSFLSQRQSHNQSHTQQIKSITADSTSQLQSKSEDINSVLANYWRQLSGSWNITIILVNCFITSFQYMRLNMQVS